MPFSYCFYYNFTGFYIFIIYTHLEYSSFCLFGLMRILLHIFPYLALRAKHDGPSAYRANLKIDILFYINAPGHRDYIKNMTTSTVQANVASSIEKRLAGRQTMFDKIDGHLGSHSAMISTEVWTTPLPSELQKRTIAKFWNHPSCPGA